MKGKAIFNWSTGKDSALALHKVLRGDEYDVRWLLTTVSDRHQRVSMHGIRLELLEAQAASIGIPLVQVRLPDSPTMESYERAMDGTLARLRAEGATASIFGDIFLEDLRAYREQKLASVGLQAVFPLWQAPTRVLARELLDLGYVATTSCVNAQHLDRHFVGRVFDDEFLQELPPDVDACGENGEFHTFVSDGPIFRRSVHVTAGEIVHRDYEQPASRNGAGAARPDAPGAAGFWYCDLLLASTERVDTAGVLTA